MQIPMMDSWFPIAYLGWTNICFQDMFLSARGKQLMGCHLNTIFVITFWSQDIPQIQSNKMDGCWNSMEVITEHSMMQEIITYILNLLNAIQSNEMTVCIITDCS